MKITKLDNILNMQEGWDLFLALGGEYDGEYLIEKIDEKSSFNDDIEATLFVIVKGYVEGSKRHIKALKMIKNSPKEQKNIKKWVSDTFDDGEKVSIMVFLTKLWKNDI